MALKAYINGKETGHIAFKGDHEPVQIYANGELVENISYIPQEVTGNTSVDYKSEYKNNLLKMQVEGGTHQDEVNFVDATIDIPDSSGRWDTGSSTNIYSISTMDKLSVPAYPCKLNLTDYYGSDATYAFDYAVVSYNKQAILDVYETGDFSELMVLYEEGGIYGEDYHEIEVTQDFYLGIICSRNMIELGVPNYENTIGSAHLVATSQSPIYNAGDNGIECVLSGANLFDIDTVLGNMDTVLENIPKGWTKQADGSWYTYNVGLVSGKRVFTNTEGRKGKLTLLVNQRTSKTPTNSNNGLGYAIVYTDRTVTYFYPDPTTSFEDYSFTTNPNKTVDRINFTYHSNWGAYIKSIMISWGGVMPYEPYRKQTLSLPSSVTLADGTVVDLRFGLWDNLLIDRISGKVTYTEGTLYEDISSQNFVDRTQDSTFTDGRRWFQMRESRNVENGLGYCNIVSPTTTDFGNYNHFRVSGKLIALIIQGFSSLAEFNTYKANNPIIIQCKLHTPIEYVFYDKSQGITTEFGQALLDFVNATQNATNVIEITSTPSVSSLSVEYAKWGGIE